VRWLVPTADATERAIMPRRWVPFTGHADILRELIDGMTGDHRPD
jgi:hypothetical protein